MNRLPPMPPTKAPWADDEALEELEDEESEGMDSIGNLPGQSEPG